VLENHIPPHVCIRKASNVNYGAATLMTGQVGKIDPALIQLLG